MLKSKDDAFKVKEARVFVYGKYRLHFYYFFIV